MRDEVDDTLTASPSKRKLQFPFAPIRVAILEHFPNMKLTEIAVLFTLLLLAVRKEKRGLPLGLVYDVKNKKRMGIQTFARIMGRTRPTIRKAIKGLIEKRYIECTPQGFLVLNFEGGDRQDHGEWKEDDHGKEMIMAKEEPPQWPRYDHRSGKNVSTQVIKALPISPSIKEKDGRDERDDLKGSRVRADETPSLPLDDFRKLWSDDPEEEPSSEEEKIRDEISWNAKEDRIEMTPRWRRWLVEEHLDQIACDEKIHVRLDKRELQLALSKLDGHLIRNRFKTGKATLHAIAANWFATDLRMKNQRVESVEGCGNVSGDTFTDRLARQTMEKVRRQHDETRMGDVVDLPRGELPSRKEESH